MNFHLRHGAYMVIHPHQKKYDKVDLYPYSQWQNYKGVFWLSMECHILNIQTTLNITNFNNDWLHIYTSSLTGGGGGSTPVCV